MSQPAPGAIAGGHTAARRSAARTHAAPREGVQEDFGYRRRVMAEQPPAGVAHPSDRAHEFGVTAVSHAGERIAIHERGLEDSAQSLAPGTVVRLRATCEQRSRSQVARQHSDANPKSPERILESRRFTGKENPALARAVKCFRPKYTASAPASMAARNWGQYPPGLMISGFRKTAIGGSAFRVAGD